MKSIQELLSFTKHQLPICHQQLALEIDGKLRAGTPYQQLKGVKIRRNSSLVRFKLGRSFRIIYKLNSHQAEPLTIITRQHFDKEIHRR
ncbi:MAG TPA: hypothetical protein VK958_08635 [Methylophilus sp.]|uniref:ParE family toxin-like protein n=1 Tax=Methylophilus sp. TaxID=29541 RepID=UPI002D15C280|nr:hypothetical protein [Methylophilus sp.]HSH87297.1 hypothetical protein [Methylophilus sp.]